MSSVVVGGSVLDALGVEGVVLDAGSEEIASRLARFAAGGGSWSGLVEGGAVAAWRAWEEAGKGAGRGVAVDGLVSVVLQTGVVGEEARLPGGGVGAEVLERAGRGEEEAMEALMKAAFTVLKTEEDGEGGGEEKVERREVVEGLQSPIHPPTGLGCGVCVEGGQWASVAVLTSNHLEIAGLRAGTRAASGEERVVAGDFSLAGVEDGDVVRALVRGADGSEDGGDLVGKVKSAVEEGVVWWWSGGGLVEVEGDGVVDEVVEVEGGVEVVLGMDGEHDLYFALPGGNAVLIPCKLWDREGEAGEEDGGEGDMEGVGEEGSGGVVVMSAVDTIVDCVVGVGTSDRDGLQAPGAGFRSQGLPAPLRRLIDPPGKWCKSTPHLWLHGPATNPDDALTSISILTAASIDEALASIPPYHHALGLGEPQDIASVLKKEAAETSEGEEVGSGGEGGEGDAGMVAILVGQSALEEREERSAKGGEGEAKEGEEEKEDGEVKESQGPLLDVGVFSREKGEEGSGGDGWVSGGYEGSVVEVNGLEICLEWTRDVEAAAEMVSRARTEAVTLGFEHLAPSDTVQEDVEVLGEEDAAAIGELMEGSGSVGKDEESAAMTDEEEEDEDGDGEGKSGELVALDGGPSVTSLDEGMAVVGGVGGSGEMGRMAERSAMVEREKEELKALLEEEKRRHETLRNENSEIQALLSRFFEERMARDAALGAVDGEGGGGAGGDGGETAASVAILTAADKDRRYREKMKELHRAERKMEESAERHSRESLSLRQGLARREVALAELEEALVALKTEVLQTATQQASGRKLPKATVRELIKADEEARERVKRVRIAHAHAKGEVKDLEDRMRNRDSVGEGLALIDFEQLKIENATVHEKIEDREEELRKLRAKTTTTVQVLTHVKEKLQFVEREHAALKAEHDAVEADVAKLRQSLAVLKKQRAAIRAENERRRSARGFAHEDALAVDFERLKVGVAEMKQKIDRAKARHARLTSDKERALLESRRVERAIKLRTTGHV